VSTTHPTSSATSTSARTRASDSFIALDIALRRSGRFMVNVATPSSTTASKSSVPVSIVLIAPRVRGARIEAHEPVALTRRRRARGHLTDS
jgi:hypothetical protein